MIRKDRSLSGSATGTQPRRWDWRRAMAIVALPVAVVAAAVGLGVVLQRHN